VSKSTETVKFTFKLITVLVIFFAYFILINFLCSSYLNTFSGYFIFYNTTSFFHSTNLLNLNILREYLFDKNTRYKNQPIEEIVNKAINDFYEFKLTNNKVIKIFFLNFLLNKKYSLYKTFLYILFL